MHNKFNVMGWSRFWLARFAFVRSLATSGIRWLSDSRGPMWNCSFVCGSQNSFSSSASSNSCIGRRHYRLPLKQNPFPPLAPTVSAYLSTGANLICAILLALGLMTRYASLPLLILAAITQFRFEPFDTQLFWIALFCWYVIHGAGPISLDHLLRRGLADSAIPLVPACDSILPMAEDHRHAVVPHGVASMAGRRAVVAASADARLLLGASAERWLPLDVAMRLPMVAALVGGVALMLGAGTR